MQSESYRDIEKKFRRGPQIVMRKDAAVIAAETGLRPDWRCLDLGGGSGFLALFLANLVPEGSVAVYEISESNAGIIRENIRKSGFRNILVRNKPAQEFTGKNYDLITIDMKGAEFIIDKCHNALKGGGWLAIYSPQIEQQLASIKTMEEAGFQKIKTLENIQREWSSKGGFTHPRPKQIVHTGFITMGRKVKS